MTPASLVAASAVLAATTLLGSASAQQAATAGDLSSRPVPPIVEQWATAWNAGDAAGLAALFAPDGTYEDLAFQVRFRGQDGVAAWVDITTEAIPDARVEVIDAFQMGDRVAVRWTFSGTPLGFGPIPSTGENFAVPAASIFEMDGELIESVTDFYNLADLFRQVGIPSGLWVLPNP